MPARHFSDKLQDAIDRTGTPACVGLDPVLERLPTTIREQHTEPVDAIGAFCNGVLEACDGIIPVIKPQSACFERYGAGGVDLLRSMLRAASDAGFVTILDAKRGDIGISAEHYAAAAFDGDDAADALTVSPYLGRDSLEPFLRPGRGIFVLVRTSNPGSDDLQRLRLDGGSTLAEATGRMVAQLGSEHIGEAGLSDIGAVVGVTKAGDGPAMRSVMPDQFFLAPGFGAQGGGIDDVRQLMRADAKRPGVIVNASRSVIYGFDPSDANWTTGVGSAAREFADALRTLRSS